MGHPLFRYSGQSIVSRSRSSGAKASRAKAADPARLISRADAAVYGAKEAGRNQVVAWNRRIKPKAGAAPAARRARSKTHKKQARTSRKGRPATGRATRKAA